MLLTKFQLLLIGSLLAAVSSLLTHLYDQRARQLAIQQNAFQHAHWAADPRLF